MLQSRSPLKQLGPLCMLPVSPFWLECNGPLILCIPDSKTPGSTPSLPWCSLPETPGRAILPGCSVEHIFNILSCPDWPEGYCMNNLPFNLFKGLLLTAPFKIVLLGHLIERAYSLTVIVSCDHPSSWGFRACFKSLFVRSTIPFAWG